MPSCLLGAGLELERFFEWVEGQYRDPLLTLSFEDWRPQEPLHFSVTYSRPAGSLSQRERFMYTLLLAFSNSGLAHTESTETLVTQLTVAVLHADGKGRQAFNHPDGISNHLADLQRKTYDEYFKPPSVNEAFQIVHNMASELGRNAPETPLGAWCARQLGGQAARAAVAGGLNGSKIYTSAKEKFGLPLGRTSKGEVVYYSGNRALVTIAPPDSGKSLAQAVPALLAFEGHVFVLDIKGQCFLKTWQERKRLNGRIIVFNPLDDAGACYNPLQFVSDNPDECWGESAALGELIIPVQSTKDPGWELMGRRMISLFIAYVVLTEKPENRVMARVLDLAAGIGVDEALEVIIGGKDLFPGAMQRTARNIREIRDPKSHAQLSGILQAMEQNLSIWQDPRVERATRKSDWTPMDFRGDTPVSLYLTIPLEALSSYGPLLRVIVAQHVFQLMRQMPAPEAKPIVFMLDEFPQLGRMDPVRKAIEAGRDYGIRTWMFAQFRRQFEDTYGDAGKGIIDICGVRMFMNPTFQDAEVISKEFGTQRDMLTEKKEANLPPDVVISPEHRASVFVLSGNEEPLILTKNFV
jgi:type IV secretion system protein VirD4